LTLHRVEERVLNCLDTGAMVDLASELVSIPSIGGEESKAQRRVADWMEDAGLDVDVWTLDLPGLARHPRFSAEVDRTEGLGVVGVLGAQGGGKDLILNGHVDVVPAGREDRWTLPPWSGAVEGGRIWGRGSLDMKGGLCAGLFAAKAVLDAGVTLKGRLILQSVIGEEDGGVGTLAAIERGYSAHGAVIMEPTGLAICPAQAGSINFRITIRGRAAHGCIRQEGVSALEKYFSVQEELLALEERRNHNCRDPLFGGLDVPFPLSVGKIRGGDWASTVPDEVCVEGRYGIAPWEDLDSARAQFVEAVARCMEKDDWLRENPPEVEWWGGMFLPARTSVEDPLVRGLQGVLQDLGRGVPSLEGVPFGSDMRLLVREAGIPTVLFGPGHIRNAHAADESVAIEDLEITARTLAVTALRFCGFMDDSID